MNSPSEFLRLYRCFNLSAAAIPIWVQALIRCHRCVSTYARLPSSRSFQPQAISASRWFAPHTGLRVYFISQPNSGLWTVQGCIPPSQQTSLSASRFPLAVTVSALARKRATTLRRLGFEALLHDGSRAVNPVISRNPRSRPSSVSHSPPGYSRPPDRFLSRGRS